MTYTLFILSSYFSHTVVYNHDVVETNQQENISNIYTVVNREVLYFVYLIHGLGFSWWYEHP